MSANSPWNYAPKWETCAHCGLTAPDVVNQSCPDPKRCAKVLAKEPLSSDDKWLEVAHEK